MFLPISAAARTIARRVASQVVGPDIDMFEVDPKVTPTAALRDSRVWLAEMVFWYLEHGEYPYA